MTDQEKNELYLALHIKRSQLYNLIMTPLTVENSNVLGPVIQAGQIEFHLCNAIISELLNKAPMAYPGPEVVALLQQRTAAVSEALADSANLAGLAAAFHGLIAAWPG
jgi:hypothetical protein